MQHIAHWMKDWGWLLLDAYALFLIATTLWLQKSALWRYKDARRIHMALRTGIMPVNVGEPWYVKGVDKVMSRWLN